MPLLACASSAGEDSERAEAAEAVTNAKEVTAIHAGEFTLRDVRYRLEVTTRVPRSAPATQSLNASLYTGVPGGNATCSNALGGVTATVRVRVLDPGGAAVYDRTESSPLIGWARLDTATCNAAVQNRLAPATRQMTASVRAARDQQMRIRQDVVGLGIFETYGTLTGISLGGNVAFTDAQVASFLPQTDGSTRSSRTVYAGTATSVTLSPVVSLVLGVNPTPGQQAGITDWEQRIPVSIRLQP